MTYQVLSTMKVKTKQGETILSPGQIINLDSSKAESLLTEGKIKLTSPEEIMDSILLEAKNRIVRVYKGKQCHQTNEIKTIEEEMGRIYRAVLDGQGSLSDFQSICQQWSQAHIENFAKYQTKQN